MAIETLTESIVQNQLITQIREGKIRKTRKPSVWLFPNTAERQYEKLARKTIQKLHSSVVKNITKNIRFWNNENKREFDSISFFNIDDWADDIKQSIEDIKKDADNLFDQSFLDELLVIAVAVNNFNAKQSNKVLNSALGINIFLDDSWTRKTIKSWIETNIELWKSLTQEYTKEVNRVVSEGIRSGLSSEEISKNLTKVSKKYTKSRADLIVKDQIGKLDGVLTKRRQQEIGISTYIWRTKGDKRVRPKHRPLNRKLCKWSDPTVFSFDDGKTWRKRSSIGAASAHPKQEIRCRCDSEANYNDIFNKAIRNLR